MSTRSQRRKEKHKKKRQEKKEQQRKRQEEAQRAPYTRTPDMPMGTNARHRQRLMEQAPKAWPSELPEDVAVFDEAAFAALPLELAEQALAVREALQWACDSRGEEAVKCTAAIPRSSPYSEWRLLVRGLVSWLAGDANSASEAWQRLSPERRPARIATAMMNSLRTDLDQIHLSQPSGTAAENAASDWSARLDEPLLYHAKLLRRVRFDRSAIKIAEAGLRLPEETKDLLVGPRKLHWIQRFAAEYRDTEPDLIAALRQAALQRAFSQNYVDVFRDAASMVPGPAHDRNNLLLRFFYFMRFANTERKEKEAERYLERYLKEDLPKNTSLSEPLRAAITSQIHLAEANVLIQPKREGFFGFMWDSFEDTKGIRKRLKASIEAYPQNRAAHKKSAAWIKSTMDDDRMTQKEREPHIEELAQVMTAWSQHLPDDVEPRLWLVDYLLENEQTEAAKPHVDWLAASRQDDPRVRATPWKWELLEAMRLCRRKTWLADVPQRLAEAERLWPGWLSKLWLPYFHAALALRASNKAEYETQRERIVQESSVTRDSLADACMMLGAAQHMRVPAGDLKPLRTPVDQAVKDLGKLSDAELLAVSGFFWDLHRTQLQYRAYRMHGKKIASEILARLKDKPRRIVEHLDDPEIHAAVLLCSEVRCFEQSYDLKYPAWFANRNVLAHPMFVAAKLNAFLKYRFHSLNDGYAQLAALLRDAARSERDVYYRFWFASLADELDDVLAKEASRFSGFGFGPFADMFGGDDEGDDDDEEDLPFDPDCNCPDCQAARRAYEAKKK
jgi:hypothetical protein